MADTLSELDIRQEGRIVQLEVKLDLALPMIKDLHQDLQDRKSRWSIITHGIRYAAWIGGGVVTLLGFSKSESFASWMSAIPH